MAHPVHVVGELSHDEEQTRAELDGTDFVPPCFWMSLSVLSVTRMRLSGSRKEKEASLSSGVAGAAAEASGEGGCSSTGIRFGTDLEWCSDSGVAGPDAIMDLSDIWAECNSIVVFWGHFSGHLSGQSSGTGIQKGSSQ